MMDKDKITAEWAKKTATENLGITVQSQLNKCLSAIESAVANNNLTTGITIYIHPLTKKELIKRGFKVETTSDQRDGDYTTISW